jgi:hypothetical protein
MDLDMNLSAIGVSPTKKIPEPMNVNLYERGKKVEIILVFFRQPVR